MPYLQQLTREQMDAGNAPVTAGELTYCITREIQRHLGTKKTMRYEDIARVLGAIEGAKVDFVYRIVQPYELKKQLEHGDVWS